MFKINFFQPADTKYKNKSKKTQGIENTEAKHSSSKIDTTQQCLAAYNVSSVRKNDKILENNCIKDINNIATQTEKMVKIIAESDIFEHEELSDEDFDLLEEYYNCLNENWTNWQQKCDSLKFNCGHKTLFEHFQISPKELSNLHRNIESLHMSILKYTRNTNPEYKDLIPELARKILDDGTLEELCKFNECIERPDISKNSDEWQTFWRGEFRDVDRPTSDPDKLKKFINES